MPYLASHSPEQVLVKKAVLRYKKLRYELWKNIALLSSIVVILEEFRRLSPILRRSSSWQYLDINALILFDYAVIIMYRLWRSTPCHDDCTLDYFGKYIRHSMRKRTKMNYLGEFDARIRKLLQKRQEFEDQIFKKLDLERNKLVAHLDVHVLLKGRPRSQKERDKERRRLGRQERDLKYIKRSADFLYDYFLALCIGPALPRYVYGLDKTYPSTFEGERGRVAVSRGNIATLVLRQLGSALHEVHVYGRDEQEWEKLYGKVTNVSGKPTPRSLIEEIIDHIEKEEKRLRR
jgi:hypothetical protein